MTETIAYLTDLMKSFGPFAGLLLAIIWAGWKGVWVWGKDHEKLERDRDHWQALAMQLGGMSEAIMRARANEAK